MRSAARVAAIEARARADGLADYAVHDRGDGDRPAGRAADDR